MKNKETIKSEIYSFLKTFLIALVIGISINRYVIINAEVTSGSMEGTIMTNDIIIGNRLAYTFSNPKRFDVVVFDAPDGDTEPYLKRIIGLPGESLSIIDGKVYINDSEVPLDDSFIREPWIVGNGPWGPYQIPENHYFMLGDNRNNSFDSPDWVNPFVPFDEVQGKIDLRVYPLQDISIIR